MTANCVHKHEHYSVQCGIMRAWANNDEQSLLAQVGLCACTTASHASKRQDSRGLVSLYRSRCTSTKRLVSSFRANAGTDLHPTHSKRWTKPPNAARPFNHCSPQSAILLNLLFFLCPKLPCLSFRASYHFAPTTGCSTPNISTQHCHGY